MSSINDNGKILENASKNLRLQGLRALSVILVIIYHAGLPIKAGFVGVDIFFVISGYIIFALFLGELQRNANINLKEFYLRRFKRLFPALAFMLILVTILSSVFISLLSNQKGSYLIATRELTPGQQISVSDIAIVKVNVAALTDTYLTADQNPVGSIVINRIPSKSLIANQSISTKTDLINPKIDHSAQKRG